jgi:hypothetical protein
MEASPEGKEVVATAVRSEGRGFSIGRIIVAATRPLPGALPAGAPLDDVGTERVLDCGGHAPNIAKDGTPQKARERHPADRPESVPGTRSNAQEWLVDASHGVPGTVKGVEYYLEYSIIPI